MRSLFCAIILCCVAGRAHADQRDPLLESLFVQLKMAKGDVRALEADIEDIWLTAPEKGTALLTERILLAIEVEEYEVAETLAIHLTEIAPSFAEGHALKGQLAGRRGDSAEASRAFRQAVQLEPRHYIALERLGDLALSEGSAEKALNYYQDALEWNPSRTGLSEKVDVLTLQLRGQEI